MQSLYSAFIIPYIHLQFLFQTFSINFNNLIIYLKQKYMFAINRVVQLSYSKAQSFSIEWFLSSVISVANIRYKVHQKEMFWKNDGLKRESVTQREESEMEIAEVIEPLQPQIVIKHSSLDECLRDAVSMI